MNRCFLFEDFQSLTATTTTEKQTIQINGLRRYVAKLEQQVEVLENCRSADFMRLQSFQRRVVDQQRAIAHLEHEVAGLKEHLNPRQAA